MDFMEDGAAHTMSSANLKESNMLTTKMIKDFWFFLKIGGHTPCSAWRIAKFINDRNLPGFLKDQA